MKIGKQNIKALEGEKSSMWTSRSRGIGDIGRWLASGYIFVVLASMCLRHMSRLSRCTPRYATSAACGTGMLCNSGGRQVCRFSVKLAYLLFVPYVRMHQSSSHFSTSSRRQGSFDVSSVGDLERVARYHRRTCALLAES